MIGNPRTERTILNKVFSEGNNSLNISDVSVEIVKMNAQVCNSDSVEIAGVEYDGVLIIDDVLPSDVDGEDSVEKTETVTVAGGATDSGSNSVTKTYVLVDSIKRIKGNVMSVVKYYISSSSTSGTVTITGINVEVGVIDGSGVTNVLASKSKSLSISTTSSLYGRLCLFLGEVDYEFKSGERLYVKVDLDYEYSITNSGTSSITVDIVAGIVNERGVSDTYIRLPVGMM